jgi:hypothetical protein
MPSVWMAINLKACLDLSGHEQCVKFIFIKILSLP